MKFLDCIVKIGWIYVKHNDKKMHKKITVPEGVTVIKDIQYINDNKPEHKLDILYPEGTDKKLPVIINVHGGGFAYGDIELYDQYCKRMALRGYTVISFNYGLAPSYRFPSFISDCISAINYIAENGYKYNCDTSNVFMNGDSAGGYLAGMLAAISTNKDLRDKYSKLINANIKVKFNAVMLACGLYDFNTCVKAKFIGINTIPYTYLGMPVKKYANHEILSVINNITSKFPPTFVMTTDFDGLSVESYNLVETLKKYDIDYIFKTYDKDKKLIHVYHLNPLNSECEEIMDIMDDFFKSHMIKKEITNENNN
jgi:acetyl esterase/lipase